MDLQAQSMYLRLSALRALLGHVPPSLRAVSVALLGSEVVGFRAIFDEGATDAEVELLSIAATEIIADFSSPWRIAEECVICAAPAPMEHLTYLIFLRYEADPTPIHINP